MFFMVCVILILLSDSLRGVPASQSALCYLRERLLLPPREELPE